MLVVQVESLFFLRLVFVENFFCDVATDFDLAFEAAAAFFLLLGTSVSDGCFILLVALVGGSSSGSGVSGLVSRNESVDEVAVGFEVPS